MSDPTASLPGRVVLDWRHGRIGSPQPCVLCDGLSVCRSPVKDMPCHKGCAETWITAHARNQRDRARLIHTHTPRPRKGGAR